MAKLDITVVHPTKRADNVPMALTELASYSIESKPAAAPVSAFNPVKADTAVTTAQDEFFVDNVGKGTYDFRVRWLDKDGVFSAYATAQVVVPQAAPGVGSVAVVIAP